MGECGVVMELSHYNFQIDDNGVVYYDSGIVIPDGNPLHEAYLAWVAEGNTAEEWAGA